MKIENDKIRAKDLNAVWPNEGDTSLESRQQFEKLHREFLKSACNLELNKLYEIIPESYGESYQELKNASKDWRSFYFTLWELIPACGEKDSRVRNKQIIDAMYQTLSKNADFCQKGYIDKEKSYVVLELILDILMAGWFKDKMGYPAILCDLMVNMKDGELDGFYGRKAQLHICSYMMTKLSEEEKEEVCTKEARPGIFGAFEQELKKYIYTTRQLRKEPVSSKEKQEDEKVSSDDRAKENENRIQSEEKMKAKAIQGEEAGEPAVSEKNNSFLTFMKERGLFIVMGIFMIGMILCMAAVFGAGSNNLKEENDKLKQEIQILMKEKEELEEEIEKLKDAEAVPTITTDGKLNTDEGTEDETSESTDEGTDEEME
ncbi:MAG: hypothetical protein E7253_00265 [Lachnospiraceae bacterium]|nr:hypothetical protein [Lachnospiraceae bacterium]